MNEKDIARFWSKVDRCGPDDCWEWKAGKHRQGYGLLPYRRTHYHSHRVSWFLTFGAIPAGMFVCHHCDNPPCVNPSHLFLGTAKDNAQDMIKKGRSPLLKKADYDGARHPNAKLSGDDIWWIRFIRLLVGTHVRTLAMAYGVSHQHICRILHGEFRGMPVKPSLPQR